MPCTVIPEGMTKPPRSYKTKEKAATAAAKTNERNHSVSYGFLVACDERCVHCGAWHTRST